MFHLTKNDIHLNEQAQNKTEAIKKIAGALTNAGYVEEGYVEGMLERESQASTYLGIGIAIPHGTPKTRHLVKKTGVQVFCFPNGVTWGDDGEKAYVAIGIAASSDEHLELLRQLTHVLSADGVEDKIKKIKTADEAIAILTGKETSQKNQFTINQDNLLLDIPVDDLGTLQALNASRLNQKGFINTQFIAHVLEHKPNYLGKGIWLNDSQYGNLKNGIVISRSSSDIMQGDKPVKMLITVSVIDNSIALFITKLSKLMIHDQLDNLALASSEQIINFVNSDDTLIQENDELVNQDAVDADNKKDEPLTREFIVLNENGLHTRPSSVLVKLVKGFKSKITVANVDGKNEPVSATSLMKIVALGAKKGSRLRFTAEGEDAEQALNAIEEGIKTGLGEGI